MAGVPVWFLDVDGVLAPLGRLSAPAGYVTLPAGGWMGSVHYRPEVVARIQELHTSGVVEVRWLTTWEDEANQIWAPLVGLGPFEVHCPADADLPELHGGWWKAQVVRQFLTRTSRSVIWTDDEIDERFDPDHVGFDRQAGPHPDLTDPARLCVVCPNSASGLKVSDLDRIEAFARQPHTAANSQPRTA